MRQGGVLGGKNRCVAIELSIPGFASRNSKAHISVADKREKRTQFRGEGRNLGGWVEGVRFRLATRAPPLQGAEPAGGRARRWAAGRLEEHKRTRCSCCFGVARSLCHFNVGRFLIGRVEVG
ncbi:hypothetical protein chiPu_0019903 [Chiloscyllium punctatum]|uniref:Uncharacterized protein n=1 Tax=Chiloscyllium punctatum TaxID=137246 RepID=A0A401RTF3_CHIPU|nr:hypothetical protein [Chiloscyllium punctatum]